MAAVHSTQGSRQEGGWSRYGSDREAPGPHRFREYTMATTTLTRRTVLRTAALATTALATPFARVANAAANVVSSGKMVLAWHTNIAPRWLDPQQHDGGA